ncbi:hydrogenase large subunit [Carboxydocella sporoproducens DSM 16521]|uniref:Hydrogenase large subunit n=2 Tax=Carboxydocella TaxID=178898 RepID=A0A1T4MRZ7_9FIRM|nr:MULTISPECIES: nickel-dependent hydrogenase large subunit [Carboxydocella]AVX20358.1 hydrogenase large subunit [Carboxydocella thermautotrophica]SJZ69574.1 hydrogenase large subunit [Carboxydocella sporoproducens DSM 16521]
MAQRIVVDPLTRIEGHLRIEADVEGNVIKEAYSSGTAFRGLELILKDRDPRDAWAFAQRICGVCTHIHAIASVLAVEDALKIEVPKNATLIRNIMNATQFVHDHVVHFYHLHALDWVDITSALKADPAATSRLAQSLSDWPKSSPGYFRDLQKRLQSFVASGQLGIFTNGYWGHPAYKLPPEVNLLAVAHYLEALEWQKDIVRIHTIFGGKNPHPNYLVGGMACTINLDNDNTINMERLNLVGREIDKAIEFVEKVYLPDLLAIASFYKDWTYGGGVGNFLVYGHLADRGKKETGEEIFPAGVILNRNLNEVHNIDVKDPEQIQEFVDYSWYEYSGSKGLHPWEGQTNPKYTGPRPPYKQLDTTGKYSWLKAPRWRGKPMEVGPLARILVGYARGQSRIKEEVDSALAKLGLGKEALFSALGRTLARGLETRILVHFLKKTYAELLANLKAGDTRVFNPEKWDPSTWPKEARGAGITEAPRGALGHWVKIKDGKITLYQAVVPTTWNASPRDGLEQRGPYEEALVGTPLADPAKPLEILRIIHSFDPCIACAVHLTDLTTSQPLTEIRFY